MEEATLQDGNGKPSVLFYLIGAQSCTAVQLCQYIHKVPAAVTGHRMAVGGTSCTDNRDYVLFFFFSLKYGKRENILLLLQNKSSVYNIVIFNWIMLLQFSMLKIS